MTDDQAKGTIDAMPIMRAEIGDKGVALSNGVIPTSLCCPSRAALLTGNLSHTTGVYTNSTDWYGAWSAFQPSEVLTIATKLDDAGYRTGLFGKYLNGFSRSPDRVVPAGWDEFAYLNPDGGGDTSYYNYSIEGTVPSAHFGTSPSDYSSDVLAEYAQQFIASTPVNQPLFLYFSPIGPHGPTIPAPRHEGLWPLEPASAIGALNESDISDKPGWIQALTRPDPLQQRRLLTDQHEVLMAVDDAVGTIIESLGNRASNTLFVYLSDNGFMMGAHRITGKDVPHIRSSEVPMYLRWDGHFVPGRSDRITTNTDLTATIAEAAGVSWPMDGRSFLSTERHGTLLEQVEFNEHPAYCGWRNKRYMFVEYNVGEGREFYDYRTDPDELENGANLPRNADIVSKLKARAKAACVPTPPGFSWN